MEHNKKVELPKDFLSDLSDLNGSTVKCYLVLKELADIARSRGSLEKDGTAKIHCGYKYIQDEAGISKAMVRKGILSLASRGWICGFKRGHNGGNHPKAEKVSNEYSIPFDRTINEVEFYKILNWEKEK